MSSMWKVPPLGLRRIRAAVHRDEGLGHGNGDLVGGEADHRAVAANDLVVGIARVGHGRLGGFEGGNGGGRSGFGGDVQHRGGSLVGMTKNRAAGVSFTNLCTACPAPVHTFIHNMLWWDGGPDTNSRQILDTWPGMSTRIENSAPGFFQAGKTSRQIKVLGGRDAKNLNRRMSGCGVAPGNGRSGLYLRGNSVNQHVRIWTAPRLDC